MTISPLAGKPAPQNILVNIPKLVSAYYTEKPDPSITGERVFRLVLQVIVDLHSTTRLTKITYLPSHKPFVSTADKIKLMARYILV